MTARALAATSRYCEARGPAPQWSHFFVNSGAEASTPSGPEEEAGLDGVEDALQVYLARLQGLLHLLPLGDILHGTTNPFYLSFLVQDQSIFD